MDVLGCLLNTAPIKAITNLMEIRYEAKMRNIIGNDYQMVHDQETDKIRAMYYLFFFAFILISLWAILSMTAIIVYVEVFLK